MDWSRTPPHGGGANPSVARSQRSNPRRGLSRADAATYIGIGVTKFDELVTSGRMPRPKCIDNRRVWDIFALDQAFDLLPDDQNGELDRTWEDVDAA
jgi:hypothetical protein